MVSAFCSRIYKDVTGQMGEWVNTAKDTDIWSKFNRRCGCRCGPGLDFGQITVVRVVHKSYTMVLGAGEEVSDLIDERMFHAGLEIHYVCSGANCDHQKVHKG